MYMRFRHQGIYDHCLLMRFVFFEFCIFTMAPLPNKRKVYEKVRCCGWGCGLCSWKVVYLTLNFTSLVANAVLTVLTAYCVSGCSVSVSSTGLTKHSNTVTS